MHHPEPRGATEGRRRVTESHISPGFFMCNEGLHCSKLNSAFKLSTRAVTCRPSVQDWRKEGTDVYELEQTKLRNLDRASESVGVSGRKLHTASSGPGGRAAYHAGKIIDKPKLEETLSRADSYCLSTETCFSHDAERNTKTAALKVFGRTVKSSGKNVIADPEHVTPNAAMRRATRSHKWSCVQWDQENGGYSPECEDIIIPSIANYYDSVGLPTVP
ncbi:hypothetical protein FB451DRAFT_1167969 [Mycena latifolia]|nr:hypothetical protein FB451DRAFT_1167969 [Mycena latifolia]